MKRKTKYVSGGCWSQMPGNKESEWQTELAALKKKKRKDSRSRTHLNRIVQRVQGQQQEQLQSQQFSPGKKETIRNPPS